MFVALGQLALRATATSWPSYIRVQLSAIITALVTCAVAYPVRLLLEAEQRSSVAITLAVLMAAAVPWGIGVLWTLGERDLEPLRAGLPRSFVRMIERLGR
jgi:hypothetical protein